MSDVKVIKDCGGSAFPVPHLVTIHGEVANAGATGGMTLRDYFAAKAMQAIIGCYKTTLLGDRNSDDSHDLSTFCRDMAIDKNGQTSENEGCNEVAQDAYAFADAMLKARHP